MAKSPPPQRFKRTFFRKTSENWSGNYAIAGDRRHPHPDLVEVMFFSELNGSGFRVAVWGNDDRGMERSFDNDGFQVALLLFADLATDEDITMDGLRQKGFEFA